MNKLRLMTIMFGIISIIISTILLWLSKTFGGNIHFEQILWHIMETPLDNFAGIDPDYMRRGLKYFLFMISCCFVWIFIVYSQICVKYITRTFERIYIYIKKIYSLIISEKFLKILFCISILYFGGLIAFADHKLHIHEYIKIEFNRLFKSNNNDKIQNDKIQENYKIPLLKDISFEKKNNIVLLLVESMENSFNDPLLKQKFMPHMESLKEASQYNNKYTQVYGSGWTIASVTGWFFGLPLKLPNGIDGNSYISKNGFLPGAESIFDILKENGYNLTLVMGSSSHFSGMNILFSGHGGFTILDKEYFLKQGWSLKKYSGLGWGFNDSFVLARAEEEYHKLKSAGKPFVLFIETIDTHAPKGFCPPERQNYNDIRDAIIELDRNLNHFSKKFWDEDVVYIILGDHFFMGNPDFMSHLEERYIFNLFHGDLPSVTEKKQREYMSALDMAPTLLQAAGARWGNDQFGLGISLFSDQPTLLEQYGPQNFNDMLREWSQFYSTLYKRKTNE